MYRKLWEKNHSVVALINFYSEHSIKTVSLTGFKTGNYLITDDCLHKISNYKTVEINFVQEDGNSVLAKVQLSRKEFLKSVMQNSDELSGICVIKIDYEEFSDIPSLELDDNEPFGIGDPIVSMGYERSQENLSMNPGIISSIYKYKGQEYIQFDATVKQGYAGSPLINAETGKVVGVIGHRLTEITEAHNKLEKLINNNLHILKKYQGRHNIDDIDPIQVLIASQNQIKYIAREIYNTTNTRLGYALPIKEVIHFFKKNIITEDIKPSVKALVNL
ncbi:MAG: S1 family peptidase [Bacteroidota bacterium]